MRFARKKANLQKNKSMRKRFEQQLEVGFKSIMETPVLQKSRDDVPALVAALVKIFKTPEYNNRIFNILEGKILKEKKKTGRKGLSLWQIFVLAQFRLGLNLDYDRLHYMVNSDSTLRQLLGIETESGFKRIEIGYQRILDNLQLLDDKTVLEINDIVVEFGHNEVFKKKEEEALNLKTDSFVVESNVHFPTDYNLLWDSARKSLDTIKWYTRKYPAIEGWRKAHDWYKELKSLSRVVGRTSSRGGKNKEHQLKQVTRQYLTKATALNNKLSKSKGDLPIAELSDLFRILELERFMKLMEKHIDLVERRLIKGEKIPHEEKLFSIFEDYTEWITKGKLRPNVEIGKKISITSDQYGLIIDSLIHKHDADSEVVINIGDRLLAKYKIRIWSFDKGFWHKDNKLLLKAEVEVLVMPKKGKPNKQELEEEHAPVFKKFRNKHSAVESNINELEHRGLNRCPDKGYHAFKRYVSMAVVAYNLHKIGKELIKQELRKKEKAQRRKALKLAA